MGSSYRFFLNQIILKDQDFWDPGLETAFCRSRHDWKCNSLTWYDSLPHFSGQCLWTNQWRVSFSCILKYWAQFLLAVPSEGGNYVRLRTTSKFSCTVEIQTQILHYYLRQMLGIGKKKKEKRTECNSSALWDKCLCLVSAIKFTTVPVLAGSGVHPSRWVDFALKHTGAAVSGDAFFATEVVQDSSCSDTLAS